jgi:hypothetical protein
LGEMSEKMVPKTRTKGKRPRAMRSRGVGSNGGVRGGEAGRGEGVMTMSGEDAALPVRRVLICGEVVVRLG